MVLPSISATIHRSFGSGSGAPLTKIESALSSNVQPRIPHVTIEHARRRGRQKRGGDLKKLSLDLVIAAESVDLDQVLAIDAAIEGLETVSPRAASLVRLRFFCGLTEVAAGETLGISERTARREWTFARAWLFDALNESRSNIT
jgi:RNA polymerase sigma factor (TIGR02999 family)